MCWVTLIFVWAVRVLMSSKSVFTFFIISECFYYRHFVLQGFAEAFFICGTFHHIFAYLSHYLSCLNSLL